MKSSKKSINPAPRELFFAAWGLVTLLFQLPLVEMILEDPQSLSLGGWNWQAFALFTAMTFLVVPALVGWMVASVGRVRFPAGVLLLGGLAGFLFTMEVNFHYLQFYFLESAWRRYVQLGMLAGGILVVWFWRTTVLRILKTSAVLSAGVFLAFLWQAAPVPSGKISRPPAAVSVRSHEAPIFFLTFEKISANYVLDRNGQVLQDRFPHLAAFVSNADHYPNFYANATATIYGLKTLYTGRTASRDRNWMRNPNIRDILGGSRDIFMLLEVLTNYCDPKRHHCYRLLGRENMQGPDLIAGWYKTFLLTVLPDPWEQPLTLWWPGQNKALWHFNPWFDLWAREEANLKPGERVMVKVGEKQIDTLKAIVDEQRDAPNLYLLHNYITDSPPMEVSLLRNPSPQEYEKALQASRRNLEAFDQALGRLMTFLKEKGVYDKAFIVITADHGYDPGSRYVKGESEIPNSADLTHIFFAVKRPGQKQGRIFKPVMRQIDVLPTLLTHLGIDPSPYHFEGVPVTDPADTATLAQRPLDFHLTSHQAGVLHYRLQDPEGPLRRVRGN